MKKATVSIIFKGDSINKKGKAPLYLLLYMGGERKKIPTGKYIEPNFWDKKKKSIKPQGSYLREVKLLLEDEKRKLENIIIELEKQDKIPSIEQIMWVYSGKKETDFVQFIDNESIVTNEIKLKVRYGGIKASWKLYAASNLKSCLLN